MKIKNFWFVCGRDGAGRYMEHLFRKANVQEPIGPDCPYELTRFPVVAIPLSEN